VRIEKWLLSGCCIDREQRGIRVSDKSIILGPLVAGYISLHDLPRRIAHIDHPVDEVLAHWQINETKKDVMEWNS